MIAEMKKIKNEAIDQAVKETKEKLYSIITYYKDVAKLKIKEIEDLKNINNILVFTSIAGFALTSGCLLYIIIGGK